MERLFKNIYLEPKDFDIPDIIYFLLHLIPMHLHTKLYTGSGTNDASFLLQNLLLQNHKHVIL